MICDVHAHYTPKNFSAFMGDRFASPTHLAVKTGMALHRFPTRRRTSKTASS